MTHEEGYKIAIKRIEEEKIDKSGKLDLSKLGLYELPKDLFLLSHLFRLNLSQNHINSIPESLDNLTGLHDLDLSSNQITSIPETLINLTGLQSLKFSKNQITSIPVVLFNITSLQSLDISENQIAFIPEALGNLRKLRSLFLYSNQITRIPESISNLINLHNLFLFDNKITTFPEAFVELINLQSLYLSLNNISFIPEDICDLISLQDFSISFNQISIIPETLGDLPNLKELYIENNRISSIPKTLGNLTSLKWLSLAFNKISSIPKTFLNLINLLKLDISYNQISYIPEEIGQLTNLKSLNISNNKITSIPSSLLNLNDLKELYLKGNVGLNLPTEILGGYQNGKPDKFRTTAKPKDILEYYFRIQKSRHPLNEAKLILVGRGGVGKTSLVNRLVDNNFNKRQKKTDGIKIREWRIKTNKNDKIRLNTWDFGGQEIMHSTHLFFLTERTLYLLVLEGREGKEEEDAEYWLKIISSFGGNSPVIIVLNKIKSMPFDLNRRALIEKYPFIRTFVKTDCEKGIGISELKKAIKTETEKLEDLRAYFPEEWFTIKEKLSKNVGPQKNFITFAQYKELCENNGEKNEKMQEMLARFLSQLGIALNFKDDPRLKDTHVINPHWITNGIYKIINSDILDKNNGVIILSDLKKILDIKDYPENMHCFLIDLMRSFELCFRFPGDEDKFLIPQLLDLQEPDETKIFKPEKCLNFQYHYDVLPEGIMPRFIVRTYILSEDGKRWRRGVILKFDDCIALVKADITDKKIYISITGPNERRIRLLSIIRSDFERIHNDIKNLKPLEMVPVPGYPQTTILYKKLEEMVFANKYIMDELVDGKLIQLNAKELLEGINIVKTYKKEEKVSKNKLKAFISYSHKDEVFKQQLETHLKILKRMNLIDVWNDRLIRPSDNWENEIDKNLEDANLFIPLISADFIASDYCYEIEMNRAIEKYRNKELIFLPIIIRPCNWKNAPFSKIQALPKDGTPVIEWNIPDKAWTNISEEIQKILESFLKTKNKID